MNARQAPSGAFAPPPTGLFGRIGRWLRSRPLRAAAALLVLPLATLSAVVVASSPAQAAVAVGPVDQVTGFPTWYEGADGTRLEPCLDPADGNCILGAVPGVFTGAPPVVFPTNFPDEFFYAVATSDLMTTPGCNGTAPGKASVRMALEGAFANGNPAAGDQMVFGRVRVKVTSGLCANTKYKFDYPLGSVTLTTNDAGAIPATVGTTDVGCLPVAGQACDFGKALNSVLLTNPGGFLTAVGAPAGYLGDGVTPGPITGGVNSNEFHIYVDADGQEVGAGITNFTVSGKIAGPVSAPATDFAGAAVDSETVARNITVTNLGKDPITVNPVVTFGGNDFAEFTPNGASTCGAEIARDASCVIPVVWTPTGLAGPRSATMLIGYTGELDAVRSPVTVPLTAHANNNGAAPVVQLSATSFDYGKVRLRTTSPTQDFTVTNTGDASLVVSSIALTNGGTGSGDSQFRILTNTCQVSSIPPNGTCSIGVQFVPTLSQVSNASLEIHSNTNASLDTVALTGEGTGGVAQVSVPPDPEGYDLNTGYPQWYRDELGTKVTECIDQDDPYCIVLPDDFYDPSKPVSFLDGVDPSRQTPSPDGLNFPAEFFYTVSDSDQLETPGCNGSAPGRAFIRMAVEGTFTGDPTPLEQMVFGRIRIVVRGGLCPDTDYTFTHPYGQTILHTDDAGSIKPAAGTQDIGCAPIAPDVCDFSLALTSPVFGGFVRWDPAVAPAAPAGYLGDALTLHTIVGSPEGTNYFKIEGPNENGDVVTVGETDQFTVMGKLRGPFEVVDGAPNNTVKFGGIGLGSTSGTQVVTFKNTGVAVPAINSDGSITFNGAPTLVGVDPTDFDIASNSCTGTLPVGDTCTVGVTFSPLALGDRTAAVRFLHNGANSPTEVKLAGVGAAAGDTAAISFQPRSVSFAPLQQGKVSSLQTVRVSNAGGKADLVVTDAVIGGATPQNFAIVDNRCVDGLGVAINIPPVSTQTQPNYCEIDVAFTPQGPGSFSGVLRVTDNAPGLSHDLALTGIGTATAKAVSNTTDPNGFPNWYQDDNGVRLEPCLSVAEPCVVLADAGFNPNNAVSFPGNFPTEFFYGLADSEQVTTPGCPAFNIPPGAAFVRLGLEGTFSTTGPEPGAQIAFTRVRVVVTGGLCPSTPYNFTTPYGLFQFQTNSVGKIPANAGTIDTGCGAGGACNFGDVLASPIGNGIFDDQNVEQQSDTPIAGFLRWDPNVAPAAPDGYLGDAVSFHKVVGGTYIPPGASTPVNRFAITDLAGNEKASTDKFSVSGKVAGPLQTNTRSLDFGHQIIGTASAAQTVPLTNVLDPNVQIASVSVTGLAATQYEVVPAAVNACPDPGTALTLDTPCNVAVRFTPSSEGTKDAFLRVVPAGALQRPVIVALKGVGDPIPRPSIAVSKGVLSYGTVTYPATGLDSTLITNGGNADLNVTNVAIVGAAGDFTRVDGGADSCPLTNSFVVPQAGGSCRIYVQFKPSAIGARTGTLTLTHDAAGGSTTISLTGNGAASTIAVNNTTLGFSNVNQGTSKSLTLSIRNSSATLNVVVGNLTVVNQSPATAQPLYATNGNGCVGTTLAPGKSCNVTVTFQPTAARGAVRGTTYRATLQVRGDSHTLPEITNVTLTGTVK